MSTTATTRARLHLCAAIARQPEYRVDSRLRGLLKAVVRLAWRLLPALLIGGTVWAQGTPPEAPAQDDEPPPSAPTQASTPQPGVKLDRVEVNARRDETEQRRVSTAAKIIVGREEIEQYGDTSLSDVLKRLPSVTIGGRPGRGGAIRMRGVGNGYTQILIDGERIPRGFAIDQLSPDMVERIEIYRAPTAETGARAIAGTINIILREPLRRRSDDVRIGLGEERGRLQPNVSWTHNDVLGDTGTYNLTLSATHADLRTDTSSQTTYTDLTTGHVDLSQRLLSRQHGEKTSLHLSSRWQWQLGQGDQFSVQPFFVLSQGSTQTAGTLDQFAGSAPAPYATSVSDGSASSRLGRVLMQLRKRLGDATRLELRGSVGAFHSDSDSVLDEYVDISAPVLDQRTTTTIDDRSWSVNGKLSHLLADRHNLVAGFEAEGVNRAENSVILINGTPSIPDFGGDLQASTRRRAAYVQDEWDPSSAWSAYAGLRWEGIQTRSESIGAPVGNNGVVLAPLFHSVWRFDPPARDQLRISLTRSYRAPSLQNLIALPSLSTLYPAPGPNTASSADRAGNPDLRPELATGFDVAIEHYLPLGGVMSVSVFRRNIHDLMRNVTSLEAVPWATSQRWVSRPQNIGNAISQGIEMDAKFRLDEIVDGGAPFTVRANVSVYGSSVSGVQGPYNRIDQQPRASANIGGEYRMRGLPLTLGGNFNWIPPYTVQQTDLQSQSYQLTRVVDAFALLAIDPSTRLRLSLSNIVPRNYVTGSSIIAGGQNQTVVSNGPSYRVVSLRLEMRL
jgi:iron complex outermembrane receptor protein